MIRRRSRGANRGHPDCERCAGNCRNMVLVRDGVRIDGKTRTCRDKIQARSGAACRLGRPFPSVWVLIGENDDAVKLKALALALHGLNRCDLSARVRPAALGWCGDSCVTTYSRDSRTDLLMAWLAVCRMGLDWPMMIRVQ